MEGRKDVLLSDYYAKLLTGSSTKLVGIILHLLFIQ